MQEYKPSARNTPPPLHILMLAPMRQIGSLTSNPIEVIVCRDLKFYVNPNRGQN